MLARGPVMSHPLLTEAFHRMGEGFRWYLAALVLVPVFIVGALLIGWTWWEGFYLWGMAILAAMVIRVFIEQPYLIP